MKDNEYIVIMGWVRNHLHLSGREELLYSIIYRFSGDGASRCSMSRSQLADYLGCGERTLDRTLQNLIESEVIIKDTDLINGIAINHYRINLDILPKKETPSTPQNIEVTPPIDDTDEPIDDEPKQTRFVKPTASEVEEYAREKGYEIDAEYFINYYEARGWMMGKSKMKQWRSAVATWVKNNKPQNNGSKTNIRPREDTIHNIGRFD